MYNQIYKHLDHIYSKQQCGLLVIIEKWEKAVDKGELDGALLTNLSKAFNYITHDMLIAKVTAHGFDSYSN